MNDDDLFKGILLIMSVPFITISVILAYLLYFGIR